MDTLSSRHPSDLPDDALLRADQVANWLETSVSQLAKLRMRKEGPPSLKLKPSRAVRYRVGDVRRWLRTLNDPSE